MSEIEIISVNISEKKGTKKDPVHEIILNENGVAKDAHSGPWNRQVSLLGMESITKFEAMAGRKLAFGEFAENITTKGIELFKTLPLDRFFNDELELEVTQIGKSCHGSSCAIFKEVGNCVMPKEGIFCRVVRPGILKAGMRLTYQPKTFRIMIITLSDRAYEDIYPDKSGFVLRDEVYRFFRKNKRDVITEYFLIKDDQDTLRYLLDKARNNGTDLVLTTGGTGIGERDISVEVIKPLLDKEIPGIMELIRLKYGAEKPQALLSRSIAGTMGKSIIFALPGSEKAVKEYWEEISRGLLHMIYMINNIDSH